MTPLDLSAAPPRSCRAAVDGIMFLGRAIDKARAYLPGGTPGAYVVLKDGIQTVSSLLYRRFNVTAEDFEQTVARAQSDDEVAAWLRAHAAPEIPDKWNAWLLRTRICDLPDAGRAALFAGNPASASLPPEALLIDGIDAEDAATFL